MATRAQALIPITIAAAIVGIVGLAAVPDDVKLESVDFPRGTIALDGKFLEVQIAVLKLSLYIFCMQCQVLHIVLLHRHFDPRRLTKWYSSRGPIREYQSAVLLLI